MSNPLKSKQGDEPIPNIWTIDGAIDSIFKAGFYREEEDIITLIWRSRFGTIAFIEDKTMNIYPLPSDYNTWPKILVLDLGRYNDIPPEQDIRTIRLVCKSWKDSITRIQTHNLHRAFRNSFIKPVICSSPNCFAICTGLTLKYSFPVTNVLYLGENRSQRPLCLPCYKNSR
jgi:hypothetical protein